MTGLNDAIHFTTAKGYTYERQTDSSSSKEKSQIADSAIDDAEVLSMHKALHSTFQSM